MKNDESKKVGLGLLIGSLVGAGALYCINLAVHRKTPVLKKIGRTISEVGEMIENCDVPSGSDLIDHMEKKLPSGVDILTGIADWVNSGMSLWKKFK